MAQTLTFAKVFTAEGAKNGKAWKRWDYKTADGEKYSSFKDLTGQITLGEPCTVEIEVSSSNGYTNRTITAVADAVLPATNQQTASGSSSTPAGPQNVSQRVTGASGRDFEAEARGKTRCALVSALLPALFTAQVAKGGDPSPENARVLLEWAFNYVFTEA